MGALAAIVGVLLVLLVLGLFGLSRSFFLVGGILAGVGSFVFECFDEFVEAGGDEGAQEWTDPWNMLAAGAGFGRGWRGQLGVVSRDVQYIQ